ncbi:serine/threonine-protein kinase [Streptomyces albireticuli]|uniref:non-specific serine/threonine protein kinase n=1 Tax=Streptomyces albireticuli TaxID=1940 RepID=A0A2A2D047_9ACTN|nr:serine/threonine-protein kinase [Streptomyces albireticuli]MCD9145024.1 protein kinase [Streptomyces albireticuli]MCD9164450.1 protein kinase [Streptomyces albireticuli]MCD9194161.1 protein kinase [Streptomyces albireticuli]PAU44789.1 serine/threonine protein kinase [Streptomyces albireticuli]
MNVPGDMVDGRFELIARLGAGGMGTVWRARDTMLDREVALKAVRSDTEPSRDTRARVLREARALARLSHPHVVTIHHIVDAEPHPWIVMELVGGTSLQERLGTGPLPPAETARIGRQVLSALRAAHTAGIRHRDVKPANILLRADGTAVLTDFGIAALSGATSLTATGELIGSPEYIAPERVRGQDDDPASDLWSLGLVLYVCGEGVSPLRRSTTLATLAAVLDDPVPPPVRSGPLAPVLQALLVRDPAARPDAARLDAMLAQAESGTAPRWAQPTITAPASPAPPGPVSPAPTRLDGPRPVPAPGHPRRHGRTAVVLALAAVLVIAATTALVLTLRDRGDDRAAAGTGPSAAPPAPSATRTPAATTPPSPAGQRNPAPRRTPGEEPATSTAPRTSVPAPPGGRWIAQLFSEPLGTGTAVRDRRLATVRRTVPEATYLRSDDYASLRPGYWVIYAPGPFSDGRAALSFCDARGLTSANACIGRYLSLSADDFGLQCRPPASSPGGRCVRA